VAAMEARVAAIRTGTAPELVWLLEHPPLYTAGTSADDAELIDAGGLPVHRSGRGGRLTYHGPGQRVAYVMLDLNRHGRDVGCLVRHLEDWVIAALARLNVHAVRRDGRIGVWIPGHGGPDGAAPRDAKIAAIGVRVRRWVTYHGVAINLDPDLAHFAGIVPCGITEHGVTSLAALGITAGLADLDLALRATFTDAFGQPACATTPL
jgi:lipoyl(octanoyl) transferase